MKKIIILMLVLAFPLVASARPADPSRFPNYAPMHDPQTQLQPNYEGNINSSLQPPFKNAASSSGALPLDGTINAGQGQNISQTDKGASQNSETKIFGSKINDAWLYTGLLVIVLALGYIYAKKRKE